jgi:hypothetical protein
MREFAMQLSESKFPFEDGKQEAPQPKTPEELVDLFGIRLALLVLGLALFLAAIWEFRSPSFENCVAQESAQARSVCYEELRSELLKPPVR